MRYLGADTPQCLVEIALNLLQRSLAVRRGPVHALEAESEAGVLQFEQWIVDQRILQRLVQLLEEPHAADTLAEEAAEHAVLGPNVAVFRRDVLDDVVGGRAQN